MSWSEVKKFWVGRSRVWILVPAKDFLLKTTLIKSLQQVRVKFVMELVSHPADDRIKKKNQTLSVRMWQANFRRRPRWRDACWWPSCPASADASGGRPCREECRKSWERCRPDKESMARCKKILLYHEYGFLRDGMKPSYWAALEWDRKNVRAIASSNLERL